MSDNITALAKEMQLALDDMQSLPSDARPPVDFVTLTVKNAFNAGRLLERENVREGAEALLAEVIDDIYLEMKVGFCDYQNKTHKLGYFKERVKMMFGKILMGSSL